MHVRAQLLRTELRGEAYALDSLCHPAGSVAVGFGEFLHPWWFHSHSVGIGNCCPRHQSAVRTKSGLRRF